MNLTVLHVLLLGHQRQVNSCYFAQNAGQPAEGMSR